MNKRNEIIKLLEKEERARKAKKEYMPKSFIFPSCDVKMVKPLIVLNLLLGIKTLYSCQGEHKLYLNRPYILLATGYKFPLKLKRLLKSKGFIFGDIPEYRLNGNDLIITENRREILLPINDEEWGDIIQTNKKKINGYKSKKTLNKKEKLALTRKFTDALNNWADNELQKMISKTIPQE